MSAATMALAGFAIGLQPAMVPSSVAKRKRLGPDAALDER